MIQSVSFTGAAFEAYAEAYLCLLVSASEKKKNAEAIKFLIIKKHVFKNKMYFCLKKKSNVLLNKKVIFIFQHDFQTLFRNAEHLLYYPQMFVFSFHTFFVLLYQFLRNRT